MQEAKTSSNNNNSISNDNTKLKICQEIIGRNIEQLVIHHAQLSDAEKRQYVDLCFVEQVLKEATSGQVARCEECGEIFEDIHKDSIYDNVICSRCAKSEAETIIKTIRRLALENTANSIEKQRVATALSFLNDYSEEFQQHLREDR